MNSETAWTVIASGSVVVTVLSAVSGILYLEKGDTVAAILMFAAAVVLAGCTLMAYLLGLKAAKIANQAVFVDCYRLKKPGIEKQSEEPIIPKGKMPKNDP